MPLVPLVSVDPIVTPAVVASVVPVVVVVVVVPVVVPVVDDPLIVPPVVGSPVVGVPVVVVPVVVPDVSVVPVDAPSVVEAEPLSPQPPITIHIAAAAAKFLFNPRIEFIRMEADYRAEATMRSTDPN